MKTIKLLFVLTMILITASSCEEKEKTTENFFLNEDFILIDKKEEIVGDNATRIRTWLIQRVIQVGDSLDIAEIVTNGESCGCGQAFEITDELWYNKEIGDKLHFDYIRKSRFFRKANVNVGLGLTYAPDYIPEYQKTGDNIGDLQQFSGDNLEKERKVLEIEREILSLQRELEKLKEELNR